MELEDEDLASEMLKLQQRAIDFWQKHWVHFCTLYYFTSFASWAPLTLAL